MKIWIQEAEIECSDSKIRCTIKWKAEDSDGIFAGKDEIDFDNGSTSSVKEEIYREILNHVNRSLEVRKRRFEVKFEAESLVGKEIPPEYILARKLEK